VVGYRADDEKRMVFVTDAAVAVAPLYGNFTTVS